LHTTQSSSHARPRSIGAITDRVIRIAPDLSAPEGASTRAPPAISLGPSGAEEALSLAPVHPAILTCNDRLGKSPNRLAGWEDGGVAWMPVSVAARRSCSL
jgi:hypothetical protein